MFGVTVRTRILLMVMFVAIVRHRGGVSITNTIKHVTPPLDNTKYHSSDRQVKHASYTDWFYTLYTAETRYIIEENVIDPPVCISISNSESSDRH